MDMESKFDSFANKLFFYEIHRQTLAVFNVPGGLLVLCKYVPSRHC
jgi:hypothetical protein